MRNPALFARPPPNFSLSGMWIYPNKKINYDKWFFNYKI